MSNQLLRGDLLDPKDDPTPGASAKLPHAKPHGMKAQRVHSEGLEHPIPTAVERELQVGIVCLASPIRGVYLQPLLPCESIFACDNTAHLPGASEHQCEAQWHFNE